MTRRARVLRGWLASAGLFANVAVAADAPVEGAVITPSAPEEITAAVPDPAESTILPPEAHVFLGMLGPAEPMAGVGLRLFRGPKLRLDVGRFDATASGGSKAPGVFGLLGARVYLDAGHRFFFDVHGGVARIDVLTGAAAGLRYTLVGGASAGVALGLSEKVRVELGGTMLALPLASSTEVRAISLLPRLAFRFDAPFL